MRITIAERLRPFSHSPGVSMVIPGSGYEVQVFPALIILKDLSGVIEEIPLEIHGTVKEFTAQQDLESGCIRVWGRASNGFFRYRIGAKPYIVVEKWTDSKLPNSQYFSFQEENPYRPVNLERLSLGNHKLQDWDRVIHRLDLKEILPSWHRLGQMVIESKGTHSLLEKCEEVIASQKPEHATAAFTDLFLAGFQGILSPRFEDEKFQGFPIQANGSPLILLTEGAKLIRRLFIDSSKNELKILPVLPPEFHAGRLLNAQCGNFGEIDFEWTKKTIRTLIFRSKAEGKVNFKWQSGLKQFRLRGGETDRGALYSCHEPLEMKKDLHYFFDNFQR